jgi:hypothetical protein
MPMEIEKGNTKDADQSDGERGGGGGGKRNPHGVTLILLGVFTRWMLAKSVSL